jgi:hypothetical protein
MIATHNLDGSQTLAQPECREDLDELAQGLRNIMGKRRSSSQQAIVS